MTPVPFNDLPEDNDLLTSPSYASPFVAASNYGSDANSAMMADLIVVLPKLHKEVNAPFAIDVVFHGKDAFHGVFEDDDANPNPNSVDGFNDVHDIFPALFGDPQGLQAVHNNWINIHNSLRDAWQNVVTATAAAQETWQGQGATSFGDYVAALGQAVNSTLQDMEAVISALYTVSHGIDTAVRATWNDYDDELTAVAGQIAYDFANTDGDSSAHGDAAFAHTIWAHVRGQRQLALNAAAGQQGPITYLKDAIAAASAQLNAAPFTPAAPSIPGIQQFDDSWNPMGYTPQSSPGAHAPKTDHAPTATSSYARTSPASDNPTTTSPTSQGANLLQPASLAGGVAPGSPAPATGAAASSSPLTTVHGPQVDPATRAARIAALTIRVGDIAISVPELPPTDNDGHIFTAASMQPGTDAPTISNAANTTRDGISVGSTNQFNINSDVNWSVSNPTGTASTPIGQSLPDSTTTDPTGGVFPPSDPTSTTTNPVVPQQSSLDVTPDAPNLIEPITISDPSGTYTISHQAGQVHVGDMTVTESTNQAGQAVLKVSVDSGPSITITEPTSRTTAPPTSPDDGTTVQPENFLGT